MADNTDTLIDKYAAELQDIYDKRRAGENTFAGVLVRVIREYQGTLQIPHHKKCREYGHALVVATGMAACSAPIHSTAFER